jgi:hypothetical protein
MVQTEPVTPKQAEKIIDACFDDDDHFINDKWGDAACLQITNRKRGKNKFMFVGLASC